MAKRYMEDAQERGWRDVGTTICTRCVVDRALVDAIVEVGRSEQCDYCLTVPIAPDCSAPFEVVLELVVEGLKSEYEDPVESMAWDGGYVGLVHDTWDLIWDLEVTERENVHGDLLEAIGHGQWCQIDPYAASPAQALQWGWERFRTYVKHHRRFTFLAADGSELLGAGEVSVSEIPAVVSEAIEEAGLIIDLPEGERWWRARPHPVAESYSLASELGPPPSGAARDNRMSPKGIGAFYGASTAEGAQSEVAGYANPSFAQTTGAFTTTEPLKVIDLRDLPSVPSLFDRDKRHLRAPIQFLGGFVRDVTATATPGDTQNLDYIPTQVMAETFQFQLKVDGVLWRSSKDREVTSCVLFIPPDGVADQGARTGTARLVLDPATVTRISPDLTVKGGLLLSLSRGLCSLGRALRKIFAREAN